MNDENDKFIQAMADRRAAKLAEQRSKDLPWNGQEVADVTIVTSTGQAIRAATVDIKVNPMLIDQVATRKIVLKATARISKIALNFAKGKTLN